MSDDQNYSYGERRDKKNRLGGATGAAIVSAMARSKSLDAKRKDAVRSRLEELVKKRFDGNLSKAAKALGVSQPYVTDVLEKHKGGGFALLEGLANVTSTLIDRIVERDLTDLDVALDYFQGKFCENAIAAAREEVGRGVKRTPREWGAFLRRRQEEETASTKTDTEQLYAEVEHELESAKPETEVRKRKRRAG